jgi:dTMP kinase
LPARLVGGIYGRVSNQCASVDEYFLEESLGPEPDEPVKHNSGFELRALLPSDFEPAVTECLRSAGCSLVEMEWHGDRQVVGKVSFAGPALVVRTSMNEAASSRIHLGEAVKLDAGKLAIELAQSIAGAANNEHVQAVARRPRWESDTDRWVFESLVVAVALPKVALLAQEDLYSPLPPSPEPALLPENHLPTKNELGLLLSSLRKVNGLSENEDDIFGGEDLNPNEFYDPFAETYRVMGEIYRVMGEVVGVTEYTVSFIRGGKYYLWFSTSAKNTANLLKEALRKEVGGDAYAEDGEEEEGAWHYCWVWDTDSRTPDVLEHAEYDLGGEELNPNEFVDPSSEPITDKFIRIIYAHGFDAVDFYRQNHLYHLEFTASASLANEVLRRSLHKLNLALEFEVGGQKLISDEDEKDGTAYFDWVWQPPFNEAVNESDDLGGEELNPHEFVDPRSGTVSYKFENVIESYGFNVGCIQISTSGDNLVKLEFSYNGRDREALRLSLERLNHSLEREVGGIRGLAYSYDEQGIIYVTWLWNMLGKVWEAVEDDFGGDELNPHEFVSAPLEIEDEFRKLIVAHDFIVDWISLTEKGNIALSFNGPTGNIAGLKLALEDRFGGRLDKDRQWKSIQDGIVGAVWIWTGFNFLPEDAQNGDDNRVAIVGVFRKAESGHEVLIAKREVDPEAGKWCIPGGHAQVSEKIEAAARREMEEETHLDLGELTFVKKMKNETRESDVYVYGTMLPEGERPKAGDDAEKLKWVLLDDLPELAFDNNALIKEIASKMKLGSVEENEQEKIVAAAPAAIVAALIEADDDEFYVDVGDLVPDNTRGDIIANVVKSIGWEVGVPIYAPSPIRGRNIVWVPVEISMPDSDMSDLDIMRIAREISSEIKNDYNFIVDWLFGNDLSPDFLENKLKLSLDNVPRLFLWTRAEPLSEAEDEAHGYVSFDKERQIIMDDLPVQAKIHKLLQETVQEGVTILDGATTDGGTTRREPLLLLAQTESEGKDDFEEINAGDLAGDYGPINLVIKALEDLDLELLSIRKVYEGVELYVVYLKSINREPIKTQLEANQIVNLIQRTTVGLENWKLISLWCKENASPWGEPWVFRLVVEMKGAGAFNFEALAQSIKPPVLTEQVIAQFRKMIGEDKAKNRYGKDGFLVVFEGIDGSGKTTTIDRVSEWLNDQDYSYLRTKWNSSKLLSDALWKAKKKKVLTPMTFSMLHASDMHLRYERAIMPALAEGRVVLCDRYFYTSYVRDKIRDIPEELLDIVYKNFRKPDLIFWCDVEPKLAVERLLTDRGVNFYSSGQDVGYSTKGIEATTLKYEQDMAERYKKLFKDEPNVVYLDTNRSKKEVAKEVRKELAKRLGLDESLTESDDLDIDVSDVAGSTNPSEVIVGALKEAGYEADATPFSADCVRANIHGSLSCIPGVSLWQERHEAYKEFNVVKDQIILKLGGAISGGPGDHWSLCGNSWTSRMVWRAYGVMESDDNLDINISDIVNPPDPRKVIEDVFREAGIMVSVPFTQDKGSIAATFWGARVDYDDRPRIEKQFNVIKDRLIQELGGTIIGGPMESCHTWGNEWFSSFTWLEPDIGGYSMVEADRLAEADDDLDIDLGDITGFGMNDADKVIRGILTELGFNVKYIYGSPSGTWMAFHFTFNSQIEDVTKACIEARKHLAMAKAQILSELGGHVSQEDPFNWRNTVSGWSGSITWNRPSNVVQDALVEANDDDDFNVNLGDITGFWMNDADKVIRRILNDVGFDVQFSSHGSDEWRTFRCFLKCDFGRTSDYIDATKHLALANIALAEEEILSEIGGTIRMSSFEWRNNGWCTAITWYPPKTNEALVEADDDDLNIDMGELVQPDPAQTILNVLEQEGFNLLSHFNKTYRKPVSSGSISISCDIHYPRHKGSFENPDVEEGLAVEARSRVVRDAILVKLGGAVILTGAAPQKSAAYEDVWMLSMLWKNERDAEIVMREAIEKEGFTFHSFRQVHFSHIHCWFPRDEDTSSSLKVRMETVERLISDELGGHASSRIRGPGHVDIRKEPGTRPVWWVDFHWSRGCGQSLVEADDDDYFNGDITGGVSPSDPAVAIKDILERQGFETHVFWIVRPKVVMATFFVPMPTENASVVGARLQEVKDLLIAEVGGMTGEWYRNRVLHNKTNTWGWQCNFVWDADSAEPSQL